MKEYSYIIQNTLLIKIKWRVSKCTGILQIGEAVFFQSGRRGISGYVGDIWNIMADVLNLS
jgi:hypothetical protein